VLELGLDPLHVGGVASVVGSDGGIAKACPLRDAVPGGEGEHPSPVRARTALPKGRVWQYLPREARPLAAMGTRRLAGQLTQPSSTTKSRDLSN